MYWKAIEAAIVDQEAPVDAVLLLTGLQDPLCEDILSTKGEMERFLVRRKCEMERGKETGGREQ